MDNPLYSFAPDASPEFQERINALSQRMGQHIDTTLKLDSLGGSSDKPFSAVRDGEVIHLMYPQHVNQGDLLAAVITALASQIPTCVLHESAAGWAEPDWSAESRRHLGGLLMGLEAVHKSFSHTSSPADLARISLWVTACSAALSRPGGVSDAVGDVLPPSIGGRKSASKYMAKVISGLRSNILDDTCLKAIDALVMLIKVWQRASYDQALTVVRKNRINWSAVLFRAAPTEIIKGKRGKPDQTITRSPPKPSRSPWLSTGERSELGTLFKDEWSFLEGYRTRWVALSPEQQHRQFNTFIREIKSRYERLNSLSNMLHARLGKRKIWIEKVCRADGFRPKPKKDEAESFLLSAYFFKKDLTKLDIRVKKVFAPVSYLDEEPFKTQTTWANTLPSESDDTFRVTAADFDSEDGECYKLWQIWADMFLPVFPARTARIEDPPLSSDFNIFSILASSEAT